MSGIGIQQDIMNFYLKQLSEIVGGLKVSFFNILRNSKNPTQDINAYINDFLSFSTVLAHEYIMFNNNPKVMELLQGTKTTGTKTLQEKGLIKLNDEASKIFSATRNNIQEILVYVHDLMSLHDNLLRDSGIIKSIISYVPRDIGFGEVNDN